LLIQISGGFPATPSTLRLHGGYRQRGVEVGALELARVLPRGAPDVAVGFIVVAAPSSTLNGESSAFLRRLPLYSGVDLCDSSLYCRASIPESSPSLRQRRATRRIDFRLPSFTASTPEPRHVDSRSPPARFQLRARLAFKPSIFSALAVCRSPQGPQV
jgi:hypothetical protein